MSEIAISKFKARCLAVLEDVRRTGEPVVVTRRGQPVAKVVPLDSRYRGDWLGRHRNEGRIAGDIVEPVVAEEEWEVFGR